MPAWPPAAAARRRPTGAGGAISPALRRYRDHAIVLRKLDYRETDRIYTLLTEEHGKLGALARGVRRPGSRLAPALELFGRVDVQLARGRTLDVVAEAVRLPSPRIAADPELTAHAGLVVELADRVSEERHPMEGLYELTLAALEELAREPEPRRASAWFCWNALELLGWAPQLSPCVGCGRPLPAAPAAASPPGGGFICPDCAPPGLRPVSLGALKVLRVMAAGDIGLYRRLRLEGTLLPELEEILEAHLEYHLERQLRSLRFLRRLRSYAPA